MKERPTLTTTEAFEILQRRAAERFFDSFLGKLSLRLADELPEDQLTQVQQAIEAIPDNAVAFFKDVDLSRSDDEQREAILNRFLQDRLMQTLKGIVPNIHDIIREVWLQHLHDLGFIQAEGTEQAPSEPETPAETAKAA